MSQENVEAFKRAGVDAINRRDVEIRGLGDRIVAIGRVRTRGRESGVETEAPFAAVTDFRNGKATQVRTYLDPKEALEAAGPRE